MKCFKCENKVTDYDEAELCNDCYYKAEAILENMSQEKIEEFEKSITTPKGAK